MRLNSILVPSHFHSKVSSRSEAKFNVVQCINSQDGCTVLALRIDAIVHHFCQRKPNTFKGHMHLNFFATIPWSVSIFLVAYHTAFKGSSRILQALSPPNFEFLSGARYCRHKAESPCSGGSLGHTHVAACVRSQFARLLSREIQLHRGGTCI